MAHDAVAAKRQADWERQMVSIDQKEREVHQTQLKLVREQTAAFIRDLAALRQEVAGMKASCPTYQDVAVRMESVAREHAQRVDALKAFFEKHHSERESAHSALQSRVHEIHREHGERVMRVEHSCSDLREHVTRHGSRVSGKKLQGRRTVHRKSHSLAEHITFGPGSSRSRVRTSGQKYCGSSRSMRL